MLSKSICRGTCQQVRSRLYGRACGTAMSSVNATNDETVKKRLQQTMEKLVAKGKKSVRSQGATGSTDIDIDDGSFNSLRISESIIEGLASKGITEPTGIQKAIIPLMLQFPKDNFVFSSATGSGKTLSYLIPVMQQLLWEEAAEAAQSAFSGENGESFDSSTNSSSGWFRREGYPRCIILAPTRDLAQQILGEVKSLSHFAKLSSCGVVGGGGKSPSSGASHDLHGNMKTEKHVTGKRSGLASSSSFAAQKHNLSRRMDIVVATPGRLLQHYLRGNVHLNQVTTFVIDEMDTMLLQGFRSEIQNLLYCASKAGYNNYMRGIQRAQKRAQLTASGTNVDTTSASASRVSEVIIPGVPGAPRVVMVTATITRELKGLLKDHSAGSGDGDSLLSSLQDIAKRQSENISAGSVGDTSTSSTSSAATAAVVSCAPSPSALTLTIEALKQQSVHSSVATMALPPPRNEEKEDEKAESGPAYGAFHSTRYAKRSSTHSNRHMVDPRQKENVDGDAADTETLSFQVIQLRDAHQKLPNVTHNHIPVGTTGSPLNKLDLLLETILEKGQRQGKTQSKGEGRQARTMVFCNTIASCRAVDYFLSGKFQELNNRNRTRNRGDRGHAGSSQQWEYRLLSYHGDLNSSRRTLNLREFRDPQPTPLSLSFDDCEDGGDRYYMDADADADADVDVGADGVLEGQWDESWGEDMSEGSDSYAYNDLVDDYSDPVAWRESDQPTNGHEQDQGRGRGQQASPHVHAIMICTDIAARGLDIPDTDLVVMFDFPLNAVDYIHRAGRTGRAGKKGEVAALVSKRDVILSQGILASIKQNLPLDLCTSDKDDYYLPSGKLNHLMPDITRRVPVSKLYHRAGASTGSSSTSGPQSTRSNGSGGGNRASRPPRAPKARKIVHVRDPSRFSSATMKNINKADAKAEKRRAAAVVAAKGNKGDKKSHHKPYQGSKPSRRR